LAHARGRRHDHAWHRFYRRAQRPEKSGELSITDWARPSFL